ncbi:MAG: cation transporter [Bacteroidales bacterium]|nr:cation transporter [Bacteroidales bacterium]
MEMQFFHHDQNHIQKHGHHHHQNLNEKNLLIATVLNFAITAAEIIGGLLSNSLALLSDALHNLGDAFAVLIAFIAHKLSKKDSTVKKTFGYKRVEILAALFNAIVLIVIIIFLFIEAIERFKNPAPVKGKIMFTVSVIGLLANLLAVILLRKDSGKSINIRAAYLHLLGDTVSSVAVIIGSILIIFYKLYWIDPVITILIGIYITKETVVIVKEAVDILMQGTPKDLDIETVKSAMEELPDINNVHHIHAWNLNDSQIHFECHIFLNQDLMISNTEKIRQKIETLLLNKFHISHVTVQFEYMQCSDEIKEEIC